MNRLQKVSRQIALIVALGGWSVCGCTDTDRSSPRADPEASRPAPWFVDVSDHVGLTWVHDAGLGGQYEMPEIMGAGGGFVDFDGDGRLDVYLVNGGPRSSTPAKTPVRDRLLRQGADGRLTDVTGAAFLDASGYGMGLSCGDFNNDGFPDLLVTNYGRNQLWRNNGDGTFSDITAAAGLTAETWSTAACFADLDHDGLLDLFVVDYVNYFPGRGCDDETGRLEYCGPTAFPGTVDRLYRNRGLSPSGDDVTFADVTIPSGIGSHAGKGLGVVCRDFSGDGRPDLFVANDMQADHLWIQQADGTFNDEGVLQGVAYNRLGEPEAGMGVIADDLNSDGRLDLFVTHLRGETNTLFAQQTDGQFRDVTAASGLGPPSLALTGFGVVAADIEHDGDLDVLVANGRVLRAAAVSGAEKDAYWTQYVEPNSLFLNAGAGRFAERSSLGGEFTSRLEVSRGLACGDVDNDGDVDLLLTNLGGRARLFLNESPKQGNWLLIRVINPGPNRQALGARLTVRVGKRMLVRSVTTGTGYLTSRDVRVHVGLGPAERYDSIEVQWPGGDRERFPGGSGNRPLVLMRGLGRPVRENPPK